MQILASSAIRNLGVQSIASMAQALDSKTTQLISWMKERGAYDEHSAVSVGMSPSGRGMFASRPISAGERMIEVPSELMITSGSLQQEVARLLPAETTDWARLALFILAEWNKGQASAWISYMEVLPSWLELHNTVFWKDEELQSLKHSPVYLQTLQRKKLLAKEFSTVQTAITNCSHIFGSTATYDSFKHAYSIVSSRSWQGKDFCNLGMVPYVDLINHSWSSNSVLSRDPDKNFLLIVADRDYAVGEEVSISYGQLPNATLALDYGFTLPYNPFDEAYVWLAIPANDPLYRAKLDLLSSNNTNITREQDGSLGRFFVIQDVLSNTGGIPLDLRFFARVLSASSSEEIATLKSSAASDPASKSNELLALSKLRSHIDGLIDVYVRAELAGDVHGIENETRREMANAVLSGELRTLRSASSWLEELAWPSISNKSTA